MVDLLDELSDIIHADNAPYSEQVTRNAFHQEPLGLELDDFDRELLNDADFANRNTSVSLASQSVERFSSSGKTAPIGSKPGGAKSVDLSRFAFRRRADPITPPPRRSNAELSNFTSTSNPVPVQSYGTSQRSEFGGTAVSRPFRPITKHNGQPQPTVANDSQPSSGHNRNRGQKTAPFCQGIQLLPLDRLPDRFRPVFPYPLFNAVQSRCFPSVYETSDNLVVSAPTGSGKTVILELAICSLLKDCKQGAYKIIYLAPTKALCSEKRNTWEKKFRSLGLVCTELTGDTNQSQVSNVRKGDIIVTTPEKWDSMTRRWEDHSKLLDLVRLFLIDEVHILEESRGSVLEVIVSRMKTIGSDVRFVALSATVPNSSDIASWLGRNAAMKDLPAYEERFGPEFRPVKLDKHVYGYPSSANDFVFDKLLDQKLPSIIEKHSAGKPLMVFCMTRNICVSTAKLIADLWTKWSPREKLWNPPGEKVSFLDKDLQATGQCGVAFHHAGLDLRDRQIIEDLFLRSQLMVICCTSTLAVGVNLPAHLVILKNTVTWGDAGTKEYVDLEIMQMLGRAGRPQFDDSGVAVILCRKGKEERYRQMEDANKTLESCLHLNLVEHLNAEIVLRTITSIHTAKQWLRSTFLYVRIAKNPQYYRLEEGFSMAQTPDRRLEDICDRDINVLANQELIGNENGSLSCTIYGKSMARYYIRFPTMCTLMRTGKGSKIADILGILSEAAEFKDLRFRQGEKGLYKELNKAHGIRFPLKEDPQLPSHKVYILIQFELGAVEYPTEQNFQKFKTGIQQDKHSVFKHCHRIISCLTDCLIQRKDGISTCHAMELSRSLQAKVWENSANELRQLEGLGPVAVRKLINAGARTLADLGNWGASKIEATLSRNPPFGSNILKAIKTIPEFSVSLAQVGHGEPRPGEYSIKVRAQLSCLNDQVPARFRGNALYADCLIERSDGLLVEFIKIPVYQMTTPKSITFPVAFSTRSQFLKSHIACEQLVGTASTATLAPTIPAGYIFPPNLEITIESAQEEAGVLNSEELDGFIRAGRLKREEAEDDNYGSASYDELFDQLDFKHIDEYQKTAPAISQTNTTQPVRRITEEPVQLANGNWACRHKCGDKTKCKHMCCRDGLDRPPRPAKPGSTTDAPGHPEGPPSIVVPTPSAHTTNTPAVKTRIIPIGMRSSSLRNFSEVPPKLDTPNMKAATSSTPIQIIDLAHPTKSDTNLQRLRSLHDRTVPETGVVPLASKPRGTSAVSSKSRLSRIIQSQSISSKSQYHSPPKESSPSYDASSSDFDDFLNTDLFNIAEVEVGPGNHKELGPTSLKRTAPTSVTTSLPASKKTRHKATVQTMNAARSSSLLFAEHFNLHFPSSPTDVCGLQSETARKPELEKISASTAFAKPDITGGLDLQTVLPRIAEDSSVDLLEFLGDCVQFEE